MTRQDQKEIGGMRTPHRRDVSARQDLLGRELRQLFADYTQEDMPEELQKLALQLQSAVEGRPPAHDPPAAVPGAPPALPADADAEPAEAAGNSSVSKSSASKSSVSG